MESTTYEVESEVEQTHWWFVGRRALFRSMIEELALPSDASILDIGTSTGTNLRMLKDLGFKDFQGLDLHDEAIHWCAAKGLGTVRKGDVCDIPFPDGTFDLVLATDIIEHVDNDGKALQEICRVLKPTGCALVTVPAFPSLWGLQDDVSHHKRRYRMQPFLERIQGAGLHPRERFYFNFLLFLPIWTARQLIRLFGVKLKSENQLNSGPLNQFLGAIFNIDVRAARRLKIPFGVSLCAVVEARRSQHGKSNGINRPEST